MESKYPVIKNSVNFIMQTVRESSLNYSIQETPYSLYLSIRKTLSSSRASHSEISQAQILSTSMKSEIEILENKLEKAQKENLTLKANFEEAINEFEGYCRTIKRLESEIGSVKDDLKKCKDELKQSNELFDQMKAEKATIENDFSVVEGKYKISNKVIKEKQKEIADLVKENATVVANVIQVETENTSLRVKVNTEKKTEKRLKKNNIKCDKCDVNANSLQELRSHVRVHHTKSSYTQSIQVNFSDKSEQCCSISDLVKAVQTEDTFEHKEPEDFKKYPCFYCSINIANERHLCEHKTKCRGTAMMCGEIGLPLPPIRFPPRFPYPPSLYTFPFHLCTN